MFSIVKLFDVIESALSSLFQKSRHCFGVNVADKPQDEPLHLGLINVNRIPNGDVTDGVEVFHSRARQIGKRNSLCGY